MTERRARPRKSPRPTVGAANPRPTMRFGPALMARLDALAAVTEVPRELTRRYLTPAHISAMRQVQAWMEEAGLRAKADAVCNVIGRYEGRAPGAPAILLGSHIDTVVDAGKYDGSLGVLAAIAVVADLAGRGERLHHALEVVAFGEEEGVRFPTHLLTSRALVGALDPSAFAACDSAGISVRQALAAAGGDADQYLSCARSNGEIAAYLELHIEQGPVLYRHGCPTAAVSAIDGANRRLVSVHGFAD